MIHAISETVRLRSWPLLNVAAAGTKTELYMVSNLAEWQPAGVFGVAAEALEPLSARDWLGLHQTAPAQ